MTIDKVWADRLLLTGAQMPVARPDYRFPVRVVVESGQSQTTLCISCGKQTKWADMDILSQLRCKACSSPGCPKCGELSCTRNHPEFT